MIKIYWIVDVNGLPLSNNGRVVAKTFKEADKIFFYRQIKGLIPLGCFLEEGLEVIEELTDKDIIKS